MDVSKEKFFYNVHLGSFISVKIRKNINSSDAQVTFELYDNFKCLYVLLSK